MHDLYELKEMLCKELEEYGQKGELTAGSLEVVDKLAHTVKNLCKIIEMCEEDEYSSWPGSYDDGMGGSYARGRGGSRGRRGGANQYGSYARGRGRGYSREGNLVESLRELMQDAPDEHSKQEINKLIRKMEAM